MTNDEPGSGCGRLKMEFWEGRRLEGSLTLMVGACAA